MAIFYDEYITEHGGAHQRILKKQLDAIDTNYAKAKVYKSIGTKKANEIANQYTKEAEDLNRGKGTKFTDTFVSDYRKRISGNNNHSIDSRDSEYFRENIKEPYGVGKENMPKDREPGKYLAAQKALDKINGKKRKELKEACEFILSVLDEEE